MTAFKHQDSITPDFLAEVMKFATAYLQRLMIRSTFSIIRFNMQAYLKMALAPKVHSSFFNQTWNH
jgi:hypothetical protein